MWKSIVRKLNIGIYIPPQAAKEDIHRAVKNLAFDGEFAIHQIYLYLDGGRGKNIESSDRVQTISSKKAKGKIHFFKHLVRTRHADGFLFINFSKQLKTIPVFNGMIELNRSSNGFIDSMGMNKMSGKRRTYRNDGPSASTFELFSFKRLDMDFCLIRKALSDRLNIVQAAGAYKLIQEQSEWVEEIESDIRFWQKARPCELPLVSCILPTSGRPGFLNQSISYFNEQDYPNKELIIVFNNEEDLPADIALTDEIRLLQTNSLSIGAKRNDACKQARGLIIAQWDDDDLYSTGRLSAQVKPLLSEKVHITALTDIGFFGLNDWSFWRCSEALHKSIFAENVAGGTLVYLKSVWETMGKYPPTSLREDADFMQFALEKGAILKPVDGSDLFVYLRHNANSWNFTTGKHLSEKEWIQSQEFRLVRKNRKFYQSLREKKSDHRDALVSCIMPTANRRQYAVQAIQQFLDQDFTSKELIILDDGDQSIRDLIPEHPQIRYYRLKQSLSLGSKRNLCCEYARGGIILHWDDDDIYAQNWISYQYSVLKSHNVDVCGLSKVYFYDFQLNKAWKYTYPDHAKKWVAGATMAYTKRYWEQHNFPNINVGEDNAFVWAKDAKVLPHAYSEGFVASIHGKNTSPRNTRSERWSELGIATSHRIRRLIKTAGKVNDPLSDEAV